MLKDKSQKTKSEIDQQEKTSHDNPVVTSAHYDAALKQIVVNMRIHPGYHIYGQVSSKDPYIPTEVNININGEWQTDGKLESTLARQFNSSGTTVYEGSAEFRQKVKGTGAATARVIVSWQCCDDHICMPPMEKEISVDLK